MARQRSACATGAPVSSSVRILVAMAVMLIFWPGCSDPAGPGADAGPGACTADEQCPDGACDTATGTCIEDPPAACGDGVIDTSLGEECDDGGESFACDVDCTLPACGDGTVNATIGEECDDSGESVDCDLNCTATECGDGLVNATAGETCDDGNTDDTDACTDVCQVAVCGDGVVEVATEECDDGNASNADGCTDVCEQADCTDGYHNADEVDVDCGGHCGPGSCGAGQTCLGNTDCGSGQCVGDVCLSVAVTQLALGQYHTCALLANQAVRCWGRNDEGQLGYGNLENIGDDEAPLSAGDVDVGGPVVQVTAGQAHTCALLATGNVRCWGRAAEGQLGHGNTERIGDDETPASAGDIAIGGTVQKLTSGFRHNCVWLDSGAVRCWGSNGSGQLGYGNTEVIGDDETPASAGEVSIGGTVADLVTGSSHNCALLTTGGLRCWGYNGYGELGYQLVSSIGDDELPSSRGDVDVGGSVAQVSLGTFFSCVQLTAGGVRCWGNNSQGQLGTGFGAGVGYFEPPSTSSLVAIPEQVVRVELGRTHVCTRLATDELRCWGNNTHGQLGLASTDHLSPPASVAPISLSGAVTGTGAGGTERHTCAIIEPGSVQCWGSNDYGQLGYGHTDTIGDDEIPSTAGLVPVI